MRTPIRPRLKAAAIAFLFLPAMLSATPAAGVYTLYRNSVLNSAMRLHIATFDASDGEAYNRENCEVARQLFQAQSGVKTHFWCEAGRFKASAD